MSMRDTEELIKMAELAERFERYEEMSSMMKRAIEMGVKVTAEILTLLSVSYRHIVTDRRKSSSKIAAIEKKTQKSGRKHKLAKRYRKKIQDEQYKICTDLIALLDQHLFPKVNDADSKVFLFKMKADYSRYLAEITAGNENNTKNDPDQLYKTAYEMAISSAKMPPTHPVRLAIVLNWSAYYDSVLGKRKEAHLLARPALDDALMELHKVPQDAAPKTIDVMQAMWENIMLWERHARLSEQ